MYTCAILSYRWPLKALKRIWGANSWSIGATVRVLQTFTWHRHFSCDGRVVADLWPGVVAMRITNLSRAQHEHSRARQHLTSKPPCPPLPYPAYTTHSRATRSYTHFVSSRQRVRRCSCFCRIVTSHTCCWALTHVSEIHPGAFKIRRGATLFKPYDPGFFLQLLVLE